MRAPAVYAAFGAAMFMTATAAGFRSRRALMRPPSDAVDDAGLDLTGGLAPFVRRYRWPLGLSMVLTLVSTGLSLLSPWSLKILIDNVIGGDPPSGQLSPLGGLPPRQLALFAILAGLGVVLVNVVMNYLVVMLVGATEERMAADLRSVVFRRLHELSMPFHDRNRTGDLMTRLSEDVNRVRNSLVAWFDRVVPEIMTLIGILVIATLIDPMLTAAALSVVPLMVYYAVAKRPVIRRVERRARDREGELAAMATDSLRNVRLVQAFSRQAEETGRFRRQLDQTAEASITALDTSARYSPIASIVLAMGTAVVSWVGVTRVLDGRLSVGTLVVFLSYLSGVYGPIRNLSRLVSTFAKGAAARERLVELFDEAHQVAESPLAVEASTEPSQLTLRTVSFRYGPPRPDLDDGVLRDIDLSISPGETVCIVGASGVGKSTLLSLILRLYEPTAGVIELGGRDIRQLTLSSLRQRIALVPQEPWILDGTVADNIYFGQPGATRAEFRYAARRSLVDEFAFRLPLGFDTPVGEAGALLSGGQLRRIALARALVRDASILLLDEPTTGLDATSTEEVLDAIESVAADRTVLVVSHDLKVAARSQRVVVLGGGRIVESGSHTELLERDGEYALLWATQQEVRRQNLVRTGQSTMERG